MPARKIAAWVTLPGIWFYVGMAGDSPSTFRAAVMATFVLAAQMSSRPYRPLTALAASGLALLFFRPHWLFMPGFQLSYVAVLSLLSVNRNESVAKGNKSPARPERVLRWIKALLWGTVAATVGTGVLVAFHFGQLAVVALPANLLLLPLFCAIVLPWAFCGLLLGFLWPAGGSALLRLLGLCTGELADGLCTLAREVPFVEGIRFPSAVPVLCLAAILFAWRGWTLFFPRFDAVRFRWILGGTAAAVLLITWHVLPLGPPPLRVTFLSVGAGDAVVVEFPSGKVMLVDGGACDPRGFDAGQRVVLPFLRRRGIAELQVVAVSHPHNDHGCGLVSVLAEMKVRQLWVTGQRDKGGVLRRLVKVAGRRSVPVRRPRSFVSGGVSVEVVHPRPSTSGRVETYPGLSVNDNSMVLRIRHPKGRVLLTGDVGAAGERLLSRRGDAIRAEVVKIPHHGSASSSTPVFLSAVRPCLSVLTGTSDPPRLRETLGRYRSAGSAVISTRQAGHVTVVINEGGIRVDTRHGALRHGSRLCTRRRR